MNPVIDKSCSVHQVVVEEKVRCGSPSYEPGGGGLNVSRAIKKLGGESVALYTSGGPDGHMLQKLLEEEGLKHNPIAISGFTRENFSVYEEKTGQQYRFGMPGPTLIKEEWERALEKLTKIFPQPDHPDFIVASGSLPPGVPNDFYLRVKRIAQDLGARLIIDTSGEALRSATKLGVFMLKPNLEELGTLVNEKLDTIEKQEKAAKKLIEYGCEVVVVSLGAKGVMLVTEDNIEKIESPDVPVVSKVGAGDSLVAGTVYGLAKGFSISDAVKYGVAAGAAAVMTPGTELCRKEDAERLYKIIKSNF